MHSAVRGRMTAVEDVHNAVMALAELWWAENARSDLRGLVGLSRN